ncbi:MAG: hypothetical protein H0T76_19220 [Nannocystis sp.]|nr:ADYC domain-containing protein [Nannocystis sp.]MBA3548621.1 hypothetical protein [Nannocystis sp.]
MQPRTPALMTLALLACPACAVEDDYDADDGDYESREILISGGTVFNTNHLEDNLSEISQPISGVHDGVTLNQLILPGALTIDHFHLEGSEIVARDQYGAYHRGEKLVNSKWSLVGAPDLEEALKITDFSVIGDVPYYNFQLATDLGWVNHCPTDFVNDADNPGLARMLSGFTLDQGSGAITTASGMTFISCTTGAVGKAVSWGYYDFGIELLDAQGLGGDDGPVDTLDPIGPIAPSKSLMLNEPAEVVEAAKFWAPTPTIEAFQPLELAIRVVRADYCYDGRSWTVPGRELMVEDVWDIRGADPIDRKIEAVWGANGLICAGTSRYKGEVQARCKHDIPACDLWSTLADYPGGLFMTRLPLDAADKDLT